MKATKWRCPSISPSSTTSPTTSGNRQSGCGASYVDNENRAAELVDRGEVRTVLRINNGFGDDLRAGRTAQLQVIVDGTDSNTAGIVLDYSSKIELQFSQKVLITRFTRQKGPAEKPGNVELENLACFNENLESRTVMYPASSQSIGITKGAEVTLLYSAPVFPNMTPATIPKTPRGFCQLSGT